MTSSLDIIDITSEAFKSLVWDVGVKKLSFVILGFLSISPTGFLGVALTKVIIHCAEKVYPYFKKWVKVGSIVLENEIHQKAYERASLKLKLVAMRNGIDSDEFKKERDIEHDIQSKLVIFNIQYSN